MSELDTMNMLAEGKNHSGDLDVIADIAPTPPPGRMIKEGEQPPKPPPPHHHPFWDVEVVLWILFGVAVAALTMTPLIAMFINMTS